MMPLLLHSHDGMPGLSDREFAISSPFSHWELHRFCGEPDYEHFVDICMLGAIKVVRLASKIGFVVERILDWV